MLDHIIGCVDHITLQRPNAGVIICRDFNQLKDSYLKNICQLKQVVTSPTCLQAMLDKVYTNMTAHYADISMLPHVGRSDYRMVLCKAALADTYKPPVVTRTMKRNTSVQNRASFMQALSEIRWEYLVRAQTCAEQYQILDATIKTLMDEYLPLKLGTHCFTDCPWVTDQFRELASKRQWTSTEMT